MGVGGLGYDLVKGWVFGGGTKYYDLGFCVLGGLGALLGSYGFRAKRGHEAVRDPRSLHTSAVPGSETPVNTTASLLRAIPLSPQFNVEISVIC